MSTSYKEDALREIAEIARSHGLSAQDIAQSMGAPQTMRSSSKTVARILAYIGGLLVVGGMSVLIHMEWAGLGPLGHVMVTLVPGVLIFTIGVYCTYSNALDEVATSFIILAAAIEATGMMIALKEFGHVDNDSNAVLYTCAVLLIQHGLTFVARRSNVLAFTTIVFALTFLCTALHLLDMKAHYIGLIVGTSELCLAYSLSRSQHRPLAPINYIVGSALFLSGFANLVYDTPVEMLFLGMSSLFIYASVLLRSRALLMISAFATLSFIGYYSEKYFAHTIGWPITLILGGGLMVGMGFFALKINEKYISNPKP